MRSVILCEGSTDFVLLQYYMRKVYGWEYKKNDSVLINGYKARKCVLKKTTLNLILLAAEAVAAYREDCNLY